MSKTVSCSPFLPLRTDTPVEKMAEAVKAPPFLPPRIRIILDEWLFQAVEIARVVTEGVRLSAPFVLVTMPGQASRWGAFQILEAP